MRLGIAVLLLLLTAGCHRVANNVCPIDGQLAEWKRPRHGHQCEYSHYSQLERMTHTWLADCTDR